MINLMTNQVKLSKMKNKRAVPVQEQYQNGSFLKLLCFFYCLLFIDFHCSAEQWATFFFVVAEKMQQKEQKKNINGKKKHYHRR